MSDNLVYLKQSELLLENLCTIPNGNLPRLTADAINYRDLGQKDIPIHTYDVQC